ncbi:TetR/AcrR family transcriptional regulator [Maricaulis salignorans]|uniref:DNA-binding transcriptional regulator, AcrR family n=1 Tax=Maricaulis salignorans TaxID=144026 RepID=A0A1G9NW66_9PROT|nr:TetR/AcrR family transcriptional regulator [Maricaulis salignorans]SDL90639.1 DNA-binding transcriptional regulator, AcrR family [Maricaulis salignorans]
MAAPKQAEGRTPERRTRGRPARSPEQIADMRGQISACALRLFQGEGYAAISMRRLAQEAGCTAMTLYKYFDSKIDILRTLWADVFDELFDGLEQIAARHSEPVARLNAVATGYVAYWLEHREHYFMVFMSGGVSLSDVVGFVSDPALLARFEMLRTHLDCALGGDTEAGELRLKTDLLMCALNGIAHNLITINGYPWSDPEKLVRQATGGLLAK